MSFLKLNNYTIPVLTPGEFSPVEIGERSRAFSGVTMRNIRARYRDYIFKTNLQNLKDIAAIEGWINGYGHYWSFDVDAYSSKGLPFYTGATPVYTMRNSEAADGDPVDDQGFVSGSGSVAVENGTTNLLAADQRDAENAPTGYTAINGAAISADTSNYWQGTKSLKCVTDAVGSDQEGYQTDAINPAANNVTFWASVYLKGAAGGEEITIYLRDETHTTNGATVDLVLTDADTWYRGECFITIPAGTDCTDLKLKIIESVADSAITFYSDGFQIEQNTYASSWVDGTRASEELRFVNLDWLTIEPGGFSVSFWTKGPPEGVAALHFFCGLSAASGSPANRLLISGQYSTGANRIGVYYQNASGSSTLYYSSDPWEGDWHHVAVVFQQNPASGEYNREIYFDGVSVASDTAVYPPDLSQITTMYMGNAGGILEPSNSLLDEFIAFPYALNADQVAALAAYDQAINSSFPKLNASGDFITNDSITVDGQVTKRNFKPFFNSDGHAIAGGDLAFVLRRT